MACLLRIRSWKEEKEKLLEKGVHADDLDRRIYAMNFESVMQQTASCEQELEDIGKAISDMRKELLRRREKHNLYKVGKVYGSINYDNIREQEEYIRAAREVENEERAKLEFGSEDSHTAVKMYDDSEYMKLLDERLKEQ